MEVLLYGWKKEKHFLKENNIHDPYEMYHKPEEFWRKFAEGIKKQTSIWGIKADLRWYMVDLQDIPKDLLDIQNTKDIKEKILDKWENKQFWVFAIAQNFYSKIKEKFS